jgi:hypothetical protein
MYPAAAGMPLIEAVVSWVVSLAVLPETDVSVDWSPALSVVLGVAGRSDARETLPPSARGPLRFAHCRITPLDPRAMGLGRCEHVRRSQMVDDVTGVL